MESFKGDSETCVITRSCKFHFRQWFRLQMNILGVVAVILRGCGSQLVIAVRISLRAVELLLQEKVKTNTTMCSAMIPIGEAVAD